MRRVCLYVDRRRTFSVGARAGTVAALLLVAALGPASRGGSAPSGQIQMDVIANLSASADIPLAGPEGWDFDHDSKREFVVSKLLSGAVRFQFYESAANDAFGLVHQFEITSSEVLTFGPSDVGDSDGDGREELTVLGRIANDHSVRVYESPSAGSYPTQAVWELAVPSSQKGAKIADTDGDGIQEIVIGGGEKPDIAARIVIYENTCDNAYTQIAYHVLPPQLYLLQSMTVADDLDGDGRDEIVMAGMGEGGSHIVGVESTGNDSYQTSWELVFLSEGEGVNLTGLVDGGDLDGDGRKEFVVGGLRPAFGQPHSVLFLFEAVSDNAFAAVATFERPTCQLCWESVALADVDGDGKREIVQGVDDNDLFIYRNTGNDTWEEIWSGETAGSGFKKIGAGDHDGDGKAELIIPAFWIYEIDPAYAADVDADNAADSVDNCLTVPNTDQADADADGLGNVCDNCVYGPNPDQGLAVFGQTIVAKTTGRFVWPTAAEGLYVRGDLDEVSGYGFDQFAVVPLGTTLVDTTQPGSGAGFYYLLRPDCPVGSWQSSPGAEPARDAALP